MTIGPWTHHANIPDDPREAEGNRLRAIEQLRWFDHWLKDVDNGIMDEPAGNIAIEHELSSKEWSGAPDYAWAWRASKDWPVKDAAAQMYYFTPDRSDSVASVNDGGLSTEKLETQRTDLFTVDYTSTTGADTRYHDTVGGGPLNHPDAVVHARTALTYTTAPLAEEVTVVGHPVIEILGTSNAVDGEFNVYLQEVDADGAVHFLTEAVIRASHRTLGTAPYDNMGLPWPSSTAADIAATPPLNEGPAFMTTDL